MTAQLTAAGYTQTLQKLHDLERRLAELEDQTDLNPQHREDARRSYQRMIRQYRGEIELYEAAAAFGSSKDSRS